MRSRSGLRHPLRLWTLALVQASGASLPWPEFRGPLADGRAPHTNPPIVFGEQRNVAWKRPVHGSGHSSPVVGEGRVWLTTATTDGERLSVLAFDAQDGRTLCDRVVFEVDEPQSIGNGMNGYASPSPVLAPGRVYVHFGTAGTACLDARDGRALWERRDLPCEHLQGPGSSPVLVGDRLVFHLDGAERQSLVALDARTGATLWRTERSLDLRDLVPALRKAYGTPTLVRDRGLEVLVSTGAGASMGYDPCSGRELWRVRHGGYSMSARPVALEGAAGEARLVFVNTGYDRPELWAIDPRGAVGDVTDTNVRWKLTRRANNMSSPVVIEDRLFLLSDGGVATLLDATSGARLWQRRICGPVCASPVRTGGAGLGRLYVCDRDGTTVVLSDGPGPQVIARNLLDEGCTASPAVVGDALFLRTTSHLYRLERTP